MKLKKVTKTFRNDLKLREYYVDNNGLCHVYFIDYNYQGDIGEICKLISLNNNLIIRYWIKGVIGTIETENNDEDHGIEINFHHQ